MAEITVVGVGLEAGQLTFDAADALRSGAQVILHTGHIGCVKWLNDAKIPFSTLDHLYDECENFDEHAERAASAVQEAARSGNVVYAVYDVRDRSVAVLSRRENKLRVVAGPPVEGALLARLDGATRMVEASDWEHFRLNAQENTLVRELGSRELTSEVKLKLMECYPDETRCFVLNGDGSVARAPLYDLDRLKHYDHRSCALIPAQRDITQLERYSFEELVQIMHILQGSDGCPWDRAQTHESLRPYMLEEAYEVLGAINEGDSDHLYDELGDLLMQVVMHAEIGKLHGEFDISDSITAICRKMIDRHSHIFGNDSAQTPDGVLDLWARNKMKERGQTSYTETLREVGHDLPSLLRCRKIMSKAAGAGTVIQDADALCREAAQAILSLPQCENVEQKLGEILLLLCAVAKVVGVDTELALNEAGDAFIDRFEALETELKSKGLELPAAADATQEYWNRVKLHERT